MKKLLFFLLAASAFFLSSCLKDKRFDDNEIGVQDLGSSPKGILFPIDSVSFSVNSSFTPATFNTISVSLNGPSKPTTDTKFTIAVDPSKIPAGSTLLPASSYTFESSYVIPAGSEDVVIKFTLLNPGILDPNIRYGLAFTITSVDNGYIVSQTKKTVKINFSIKNKYDGRYRLSGRHNRAPLNFPYSGVTMDLITRGPNSVVYFQPNRNGGEFSNVIGTDVGVISSYGTAICPVFTFDPTTNNIISVAQNTSTIFIGLGPNPGGWDPATRTVTAQYFYTTGAGQDFSNRGWSDVLTYVGARP